MTRIPLLRRASVVLGACVVTIAAPGVAVAAPGVAAATTGPAVVAATQQATPPNCVPGTPAPSDDLPGTLVIADNFESGDLSGWTVHTGGDGIADVESAPAPVHDGGCAARFRATSNPGSVADASVAMPPGMGQVAADGWFDLSSAGITGATNPYFRFFAGSSRVASVYRYASNGQLWLEVADSAGVYTRTKLTSRAVSLSAWHHVIAIVDPDGAHSTVQVWLDGTLVYSNNQINGPVSPITRVQLGNENAAQAGDLSVDDVVVRGAPVEATTPCVAPAQPTDTMPGQVVIADGFECGNLDNWVVRMTGDGRADVRTAPVFDGAYAACLTVSDVSPSMANLSTALPVGSTAAAADGWFDITADGPAGNDEPYFRFFAGTTRFVDIYRYNTTGQLWLRSLNPNGTFGFTRLTTAGIPLNSWHRIQMTVVADGANTVVQVWLDGASVYGPATVGTTATSISSVMLGAEHYPQPTNECFDDVIVRAGS